MSIDSNKLKSLLAKNNILIVEYYCIDQECAMIKCFLLDVCEFIIIYIPSKFRFKVNKTKNVYDLENIDENTENNDYSKSSKIPDMDVIDEEKSVDTYKDLTKKYQKNITLEGNIEPVTRKLKRQIDRLKIPFSKLSYDICIQNHKYLCISFGEENSIFSIKNYSDKKYLIIYLINIKQFINKLEDISNEIEIIKTQFYEILKRVSFSNLEEIKDSIDSSINSKITVKLEEYVKSIENYKELSMDYKNKEKDLIEKYEQEMGKLLGVKRDTVSKKYQEQLDDLFKNKLEIIEKIMLLVSKYHENLLIFEQTTFDNSIMIDRINKNFDLLKKIC
jgi:hypothetical protein